MPATTVTGGYGGQQARVGASRSTITLAETNQIKVGAAFISHVTVYNVGTTATLDIYDHGSTNTNKVFEWVSADGKGTFPIQCPMALGIRVITGGTPGGWSVVWS